MLNVRKFLVICIVLATLFLLAVQITTLECQPREELQPRFNEMLVLVRQAEAAGAKRQETAGLVLLLNEALRLSEEAGKLTRLSETQRRAGLLAQLDEILDRVDTEARQLEVVASQRTLANKVIAYVSGGVAALVSSLAYIYGARLWQTYRIKRTFQMKIFPK